jgi:hypothetical protein
LLFNILLLPYHFCSSLQSQYNLTFFILWWFWCCLLFNIFLYIYIPFKMLFICCILINEFMLLYAAAADWLLLQVFHQRIDDMKNEWKKMLFVCVRTNVIWYKTDTRKKIAFCMLFHNAYSHHIAFLISIILF